MLGELEMDMHILDFSVDLRSPGVSVCTQEMLDERSTSLEQGESRDAEEAGSRSGDQLQGGGREASSKSRVQEGNMLA